MPATHWRDHGRKSRPGETQGPINWDVSVAADLLQKSSLNINFSSTLRVSDNYCDDLENSANWVKVSSQSKADFIYDPQALNLGFNTFPYPFIRSSSLTSDKVAVVIPKDANGEEMLPVFNVSSTLGGQSSWRGLNLYTLGVDQFKESTIQVSFDDVAISPDLFYYPVPFGKDSYAVIPNKMGKEEQVGCSKCSASLGCCSVTRRVIYRWSRQARRARTFWLGTT